MINQDLRNRLLAMADEERRLHTELSQSGEIYNGYHHRLEELNRRQAFELESIVDGQGWPGKTLVGEDGSHAAWFTAQHAISCPDLQRKFLRLLSAAVDRGDAEPAQRALLEDKISFFERRPQRYGTQFDWDEDGQMSPWILEDPSRVDEFRQSVGLGPLAEKIREFRSQSKPETRPPDLAEYRKQMLNWAKSVGW